MPAPLSYDQLVARGWVLPGGVSRNSGNVWVLDQSAAPVSLTGGTAEASFKDIVLPAGVLGPNSALRIRALWSAAANNANVKTLRMRMGGLAGVSLWNSTGITSALSLQSQRTITNRGALNSQVGMALAIGEFTASTSPVLTYAFDFSQAQILSLTGQLAVGTDTITLEAYSVEILA